MIRIAVVSAMKGFELIEEKVNERLKELQNAGHRFIDFKLTIGNTHFIGTMTYEETEPLSDHPLTGITRFPLYDDTTGGHTVPSQ